MRELTEFQEKCENRLVEALSVHKRNLRDRSLEGENETYIHAYISDSKIEVWIYGDEAMISGPSIDFRFESPDFDTDDELIEAFILHTISEITRKT